MFGQEGDGHVFCLVARTCVELTGGCVADVIGVSWRSIAFTWSMILFICLFVSKTQYVCLCMYVCVSGCMQCHYDPISR